MKTSTLGEDLFRLRFPQASGESESVPVAVTIRLMSESYDRLHWSCTACESLCEHVGAAFSLILDEKMTLGLAAPPPERVPVESLGEQELIERAIEERRERARTERMTLKSSDPDQPWTDYMVASTISGKTYRVAVRGREPGDSYCSCPDFRTNTLGTCKHILHVLAKLKRRFTETQLNRPYKRRTIGVHVRYRDRAALRLLLPEKLDAEVSQVLGKLRENLRPVLLRRTRESVRQQLPPRTNEIVRITPTQEQFDLHRSHMRLVNRITRKKFLTDMDLLRLQKHLLMCRMSANSTLLVDKEAPGYSGYSSRQIAAGSYRQPERHPFSATPNQ